MFGRRYQGIEAYTGPPGSGKTYELVRWGLDRLTEGRPVVCSAGLDLRQEHGVVAGSVVEGDVVLSDTHRLVVVEVEDRAGATEAGEPLVALHGVLEQWHDNAHMVGGGWWEEVGFHTELLPPGTELQISRRRPGVTIFRSVDEFIDIDRGSAVLVDEAPIWFDARAWASMDPGVLVRLTQIRHYGIELRFTAIHPSMVELRLAQITFRWYRFKALTGTVNVYREMASPERAPQLRDRDGAVQFRRMRPEVQAAYDTTADADVSEWVPRKGSTSASTSASRSGTK